MDTFVTGDNTREQDTLLVSPLKVYKLEDVMKMDPSYKPRTPPSILNVKDKTRIARALQEFHLPSCDTKAADFAKKQMAVFLGKYLTDHKTQLAPDLVDRYITEMGNMWTQSLVKDGEEYGLETALASSCTMIQATMKTKKLAGSTSMGGSLREMQDLLEATQNPSVLNTVVHFTMKMTKRMVIDLSATFVEVFLSNLMEDNLQDVGYLSASGKEGLLPVSDAHYIYASRNPSFNINKKHMCIRFYLKKSLLFFHRITPSEIAEKMENVKNDTDDIKSHNRVFIGSSYQDAYIDIVWIQNHAIVDREQVELKLYAISLEDSKTVSLKGIPGITNVVPIGVEFRSLLRRRPMTKTERISHKLSDTVVALEINQEVASQHNYPPFIRYKEALEDSQLVVVKHLRDPETDVLATIYVDGLDYKDNTIIKKRDINDVLGTLAYHYALLRGTNLSAICRIPWVDSSRVTCNSLPKMRNVFGIEACASYNLFALYNNMKEANVADIQSRFLIMIVKDACRTGYPYGTSYFNNRNKGTDFVSSIAIGYSKDEMKRAAFRGGRVGPTTHTQTTITTGTILTGKASLPVIDLKKENVLKAIQAGKKTSFTPIDLAVAIVEEEEFKLEEEAETIKNLKPTFPLIDRMIWEEVKHSDEPLTIEGNTEYTMRKPAVALVELVEEEVVPICRIDNDEVVVDSQPNCRRRKREKMDVPQFLIDVLNEQQEKKEERHSFYLESEVIKDFVVPQLGRTYIPQ